MKRIGLLLLVVFLVAGCATIITGTKQTVSFQSDPPGAEVIVNGNSIGLTPVSASIPKKSATKVVLKKDGYREQTFVTKEKFQPWFWGNILLGGVIGSTTDFASGATVEYSPDQYYTKLDPAEGVQASPTMRVTDKPKDKIVRYALVNYSKLATDLNRESGEYLDGFLVLAKVAPEQKQDAITRLKKLYVENTDIPSFAESAASEFAE